MRALMAAVSVLGIACGCADMNAGRSFARNDSFDNRSESGVTLGSFGDMFGNDVWVDQLTLSKQGKAGEPGLMTLEGTARTGIPLLFKAIQIKADQDEPVTLAGQTVRPFVTGSHHYEPFVVPVDTSTLRRLADAKTIQVRVLGSQVKSGAYELTAKQRSCVRMFHEVHVLGKSEQEFRDAEKARAPRG